MPSEAMMIHRRMLIVPPALSFEMEEWLAEQNHERQRTIESVARSVRQARKNLGVTQSQLAAKIGSTQPSLSRLETGKLTDVGVQMIQRIGSALGFEAVVEFRDRT